MKWAPNVKKIPKDPYTEAVIFRCGCLEPRGTLAGG